MKIGDKVKVVKCTLYQGAAGYYLGMEGIINLIVHDGFNVCVDNGDIAWFAENELEVIK